MQSKSRNSIQADNLETRTETVLEHGSHLLVSDLRVAESPRPLVIHPKEGGFLQSTVEIYVLSQLLSYQT